MLSIVLAASLMVAAGAESAPAAAAQVAPVKVEKASRDGKVCKKEAALGSRMKTRVCMTQAEWDQRKVDSRDEVEKSQSAKPLSF